MSGREQTSHRPGLLKQANKSHKSGKHRTKSEIDKNNKGELNVSLCISHSHIMFMNVFHLIQYLSILDGHRASSCKNSFEEEK